MTAAIDQSTSSTQNIRDRFTPCHSGVSLATKAPTSPRLPTGKNAPENKNSGKTPSRKSSPNDCSVLIRVVKA